MSDQPFPGDLAIGDSVTATRTFRQADFDRFAALSRDDNPIHVDPDFAARTRFGRPVAHGMLLYGAICTLLGRHFPGAVQVEQRLTFTRPTFSDEEMTISAELLEAAPSLRRIRLRTLVTDPRGEPTVEGETLLHLPPTEVHE